MKIVLRRRRRRNPDRLLDQALVGGLLCFATGFGWIYPPLFLIILGAASMAIAYTLAKGPPAVDAELERARRLEAGEE